MNVQAIAAFAEAIRAVKEIPSGHLYAQVMGKVTLEQYNALLGVLKGAGLITVTNHLIKWTGPELEEKGTTK